MDDINHRIIEYSTFSGFVPSETGHRDIFRVLFAKSGMDLRIFPTPKILVHHIRIENHPGDQEVPDFLLEVLNVYSFLKYMYDFA